MTKYDPFHEGERAVQLRVDKLNGINGNRSLVGKNISENIPEGALQFLTQQSFIVVGYVDKQGQVWASVLFGQPGFVRALNARRLEIDLSLSGKFYEALCDNLKCGDNVGLLFVEFETRRRLRINGRLFNDAGSRFIVDVQQAYANCPRYIQRRILNISALRGYEYDAKETNGDQLTPEQKKLINNSDTFFVASAHPNHGVDASHRGGQPGFVRVINDTLLQIPDYSGNNMFNTLGNFLIYPHAGLVFIDFNNNRLLQLTGTTEILWRVDSPRDTTGGTQRYWKFRLRSLRELSIPANLGWKFIEFSKFNPP